MYVRKRTCLALALELPRCSGEGAASPASQRSIGRRPRCTGDGGPAVRAPARPVPGAMMFAMTANGDTNPRTLTDWTGRTIEVARSRGGVLAVADFSDNLIRT